MTLDIQKDKVKLNKLEDLALEYSNFILIKSQPCFEYWFYLHRDKYSNKYFSTWNNEEPLRPEVWKIINNYEKSEKFYHSSNGLKIYTFLRPKLINAGINSLKLFQDNTKTICEIFYVVGILFCSKCRGTDCSNNKFFSECINDKHLCDNMKETFENY